MTKEQLASVLEARADRYQLRKVQELELCTTDVSGIGHAVRAGVLGEVEALLRAIASDLRGME